MGRSAARGACHHQTLPAIRLGLDGRSIIFCIYYRQTFDGALSAPCSRPPLARWKSVCRQPHELFPFFFAFCLAQHQQQQEGQLPSRISTEACLGTTNYVADIRDERDWMDLPYEWVRDTALHHAQFMQECERQ